MALRYATANLRSQMQYRSSFLMESLGHVMEAVTELLGIVALFTRFGSIRGWTLSEVALFYGVVHVVFAVAEGVGRGFGSLESHVKNGTFDRVLLRPRATLLQVLGAALAPETIGRLLLAAVVLAWALAALDGGPVIGDVALLLWAFAGGVAAFFALLMLSAALSFWTTETLLIFAVVTKGGVETTQYPIAVFHRALRYLFSSWCRSAPSRTSRWCTSWTGPIRWERRRSSPGSRRSPGSSSWFWSPACGSSACGAIPRPAPSAARSSPEMPV